VSGRDITDEHDGGHSAAGNDHYQAAAFGCAILDVQNFAVPIVRTRIRLSSLPDPMADLPF
jgi:hypothetical protein